jgi:NAD-dependent SIR2 family protein deacetylase
LARLERAGHLHQLVTQNVDGLHQKAGSRRVLDLHGRIDRVDCLDCGRRVARDRLQQELLALNPDFSAMTARSAPDADADLEEVDFGAFRVPSCIRCGGLLKPAVVFFGESVRRARLERSLARLRGSEAMLVVGSSLMVYSGYRFARLAHARGLPVAAVNLGRTRADDLLTLKVQAPCGEALAAVCPG